MSHPRHEILYNTGDGYLTKKDISNALRTVGVKEGDILMVHSDIGSFGKLANADKEFLLHSLVESIQEVAGKEGTIIMPTFTYSFLKNEAFDVQKSKSATGTLTEYFRNQDGVQRTIHPTHSVAVAGNRARQIMDIGKGTFDKNSIFGKMHKFNGKILLFGVKFHKACTFIHYIEEMHQVPYRYMKKLRGKIIENSKEYEDKFFFYYRYAFISNSFLSFEDFLLKKNILKEVKIGNSSISFIECEKLFDEGRYLLDKDALFFLKNNTFLERAFNRTTCFFLTYFSMPIKILYEFSSKIFHLIKS